MRTWIAVAMALAVTVVAGCAARTTRSPQGGILPQDKEFSITVPSSITVRQGGDQTVTVMLNRGPYFKQNVRLNLEANGIGLTPSYAHIKAGDRPDVQVRIAASKSAAIGDYRVAVKGTPETGEPATAVFTVKVVAQ